MNILYISQMNGFGWTGPAYSVPKQINAQSKYDNVFWYHMREHINDSWREYNVNSIEKYPSLKISDLPNPFNNPDLIIVEQFYGYAKLPIFRELLKTKIPYIIIPRGELTKKAQDRKKLKKCLFNIFIFRKFSRKALAIQYLTEKEKNDSGDKWNKNSIVIPNGIDSTIKTKSKFNRDKIICTSIGRIEKYQKGLDLLIDSCEILKYELFKSKVEIHLYGPDNENQKKGLLECILDKGLEKIIYIHDAVLGKEKEKILLESDIYIMTSRFEGHPMALIEALSYGIPCLVTEGSNMKKEIELSNSGWGANNNLEDIVLNIKKMIKEYDQIEEKSLNAKQLSKLYNWNEIALKSHNEYKKILNKG